MYFRILEMRHVLQPLLKRNRPLLHSNSISGQVKALLFIGGLLLPAYILHVWLLAPEKLVLPSRDMTLDGASKSRYLGDARETYVINLPHRDDRRSGMDKLRTALGISWDYVDGVYLTSSLVRNTLDWVHTIRSGPPYIVDEVKPSLTDNIAFTWPKDIDDLARSSRELELWSNEHGVWSLPPAIPKELPPYIQPMASATQNYNIAVNLSAQPEHLLLTEARVACWFGHLGLIHKIANSLKEDQFAIILEDDVDMEQDTDAQVKRLWPYLPDDWDVVFLGHCCSDESRGPRISPAPQEVSNDVNAQPLSYSQLHASSQPLCTHAYALSRTGARRLLLHFQYPPFAFSRAVDQAFAWLIESNRIKSYSVVPSLIVQRKIAISDITGGIGDWKQDKLVAGVFDDGQIQNDDAKSETFACNV